GGSPKLARRDGRPLIFGYQSRGPSTKYISKKNPGRTKDELALMRIKPEGWELMGETYEDASRQIGQPIYWHYCISWLFHGIDRKLVPENATARAAGVIAKHVQAVGSFTSLGKEQAEISRAVKAAGAEWGGFIGMYQKENIPYEVYAGKGLDWMCKYWEEVRDEDATLLQFITWNDYGENSNIAPAYNTRYTLYELTGYFIRWWKTGIQPVPDHDRIYIISRKYPPDVKVFPFLQGPYRQGVLEILTILPEAGTVRLPGRKIEYEAPAGFFRKQFPVTPGSVAAELLRGGKTVIKIESPEPVSDRPFREDNSMVCFSTEFERNWKADFGSAKPLLWSEYGDIDKDGLPNWFEMYWFGRFGDLSTAACADPKAVAPSGKTVMQEYLDQTDPTKKPIPYSELPTKGLMAWYRADQGVVADVKGKISGWKDQSGNNLNLTADKEEEKPRMANGAWNKLPAVEMDGIRNSMLCALPDKQISAMTVFAVFSAKAEEQMVGTHGEGNRLVSIPTAGKADYEGGVTICVGSISYAPGDVAVAKKEFAAGESPAFIGLGFMTISKDLNYRTWNFKGRVAEILIYASKLDERETQKIVSILKTRYKL
ncbi:MAG: endo-1,3-alpha-glucanase family glycosylhydrolase, partial [Victivallales bacterium]